jgi:TRAP-type mannitol/chloroaromatic compound transport system permease small subunit
MLLTSQLLWNFDFSMQMYGAILMMSGAYCLATEAHVRGDVYL